MYTFPEDLRKAYESQPVPFVYYRYIDQKIVPVLLSDGFCEQMGMDREMATRRLTSGLFETMHPDDAGRIKRITEGFARKECDYDVVFRSRRGDGYHYIHAFGKWQTMPDGTELAVLTYSDVSKSRDEIVKMAEKYMQFQQDHFYTDVVTGLGHDATQDRFYLTGGGGGSRLKISHPARKAKRSAATTAPTRDAAIITLDLLAFPSDMT